MTDAILGVLVGGVIALAGNLITQMVASRREHQRWLREQQITGYTNYLDEWHKVYSVLWDYVHYGWDEPPDDFLEPLYRMRWRACLVAPSATAGKIASSYEALLDMYQAREDEKGTVCDAATRIGEELQAMMKRNLSTRARFRG